MYKVIYFKLLFVVVKTHIGVDLILFPMCIPSYHNTGKQPDPPSCKALQTLLQPTRVWVSGIWSVVSRRAYTSLCKKGSVA